MAERLRLNRRHLIGGAAAAIVLGATESFAHRGFAPYHQISGEKKHELQSVAESLVSTGLITVGDFSPIRITTVQGEKEQKPVLHPTAVAEALLYISYMDGGQDNVNRAVRLLRDNGGLKVEQLTGSTLRGQTNQAGQLIGSTLRMSPLTHLTVEINPQVFIDHEAGATLAHELYHVNQEGRDGKAGFVAEKALGIGVGIALFLATFISIKNIAHRGADRVTNFLEQKIPRRRLLKYSAVLVVNKEYIATFLAGKAIEASGYLGGVVIGYLTGQSYYVYFSPIEIQAITQGGRNTLADLASQEPVKSAVGNIVSFQDV